MGPRGGDTGAGRIALLMLLAASWGLILFLLLQLGWQISAATCSPAC